ncbi:CCR4-NOT transcription complex subunit 7/8 [Cryptococcus deuterogattii 99/473]|uniref:poly(A)-specific ribonuclease n=1 Tax=Cryptococcus deuterogattii Ram5 TaxID=1296110 RepID=A0A0D0V1N5_9TREE|nr:CCR4-NOT transcription complex subunit 7/8 [Cryptococcus deuterogattii LA55]KIR36466.1 CCR4-NOT transcription complex subunit 7/8 [Cryptococcus deuterogattii MMRL2647]KIR38870.1 CCR4-NOT transcription complex subunit 7/8 [Cryptococcus deuterogattii Ram5]KIR75897.1 CCR4-NOT transcription complex subunit 7/8 [Cryptococcus deuterogattii CA1014]KIR95839.1 CCR4-NOT transcription complex subunit 7/8 [Cryptococcus deuterogattii CBS 10090]KIS02335.1 CCR4-NOT transcription complex subunit 7/8 [Crypt
MPSALLTMPQQEQLPSKDYGIREIWADNLESEFAALRQAVERYPYISMDTEFPGIVARPIGNFKTGSDYHFQTMRCNVDMLKIIQLGITLCDENGDSPEVSTWQFNFAFSLGEDMFAPDSIDLLKSSGIDFKRNEEEGIDVEYFGELLITSGLVLFDNVKWVSFHSRGYDFGYLLKILTCEPLPADETDFFRLLFIWFPCIYDIKHIVRSIKTLRGGLQEIAESLGVKRIGPQHQAGSDSLLTAAVFFRIQTIYFDGHLNDDYYKNYLYGFSSGRLGKASPAAAGENLVDKPY